MASDFISYSHVDETWQDRFVGASERLAQTGPFRSVERQKDGSPKVGSLDQRRHVQRMRAATAAPEQHQRDHVARHQCPARTVTQSRVEGAIMATAPIKPTGKCQSACLVLPEMPEAQFAKLVLAGSSTPRRSVHLLLAKPMRSWQSGILANMRESRGHE
jgi:hypothetical protein